MSSSRGGVVRILHVTDNLAIGGVQRVVVGLASASSSSGLIVGVAAEPIGELRELLPRRVEFIAAPKKPGILGAVRYAMWLRGVVKSGRWEIVHAHQRRVALLARLAVAGTTVRIVEHVHSMFTAGGLIGWLSFRGGDLIIACSGAVAEVLAKDFGRAARNVVMIPNGVADLRRPEDAVGLPYAHKRCPHLVAVGRVAPDKDPHRFVEVVRLLNKDGPRVTAEWVGDGPLMDEVRESLASSPVPGLNFSGSSLDVRGKLLGADLLVMTSRTEGLPLAAMEAMSLGRGVIAPGVGGCGELVRDGLNGVLYGADATPAEIADSIVQALDKGLLEKWGVESRRKFEERGSLDVMAEDVLRVYCQVRSRGSRRRFARHAATGHSRSRANAS